MSLSMQIKHKANLILEAVNTMDKGATTLPVGVGCLDNRPVFFSRGSAITYTTEKHTYWGAGVAWAATCIEELSGTIAKVLNMHEFGTELRNDPYIASLIAKTCDISTQYSMIQGGFDVEFGDYEKDDSKSDFFHYPCIIQDFDFKYNEAQEINSLRDSIKAMRVIDSYELFVALLGKDGRAYEHLEKVNTAVLERVVLKIIDEEILKLLVKTNDFKELVVSYRERP
ncbi:hypothetical protein VCHA53O466_140038 [Vibrio chagasii]|nr:hypothetical protein VCHA53O466_140038 [Vibrio chagasii]